MSPLVLVNDEVIRNSLMNKVPNKANGGTCIGCGLQKALQVFIAAVILVLEEMIPSEIIGTLIAT